MLQLPAAAAVSPVNKALTDRVCSLLADAATGKPQVTGLLFLFKLPFDMHQSCMAYVCT